MKYFLWCSWVTHYFSFLCLFSFQMKLVSPPHLPAQIRLICLGAQTWSERGYFQHKYAELKQSTCGSSESCGPRFQIAAKETGYEIVQLGRALFIEQSSSRLSSRCVEVKGPARALKRKVWCPSQTPLAQCYQRPSFFRANDWGKLLPSRCDWFIYIQSQRTGIKHFAKHTGKLIPKGLPVPRKCRAPEAAAGRVGFQAHGLGGLIHHKVTQVLLSPARSSSRGRQRNPRWLWGHRQSFHSVRETRDRKRIRSGNINLQPSIQ